MARQVHTVGEIAAFRGVGSGIDFESLFQMAPMGLAVLDSDLRFVACNDSLALINGIPAGEHVGRAIAELLPELAAQAEPRFRAVFETGQAQAGLKLTGSTFRAPRRRRSWLESVTPLKDADGNVRHILIGVQEITALDEAEAALQATERALSASHRLSPDGLTIIRAIRDDHGQVVDFTWEYANPAAEAIVGERPLAGRRLSEVLPGNMEHPELFPRYARLLTEAGASEVEISYEQDGKTIWFSDTAVGIDADRVAVGFRNISRRKFAEEQTELVSGEFRHRVKNVIAVVASLVAQQARFSADVPEFSSALLRRLDALAGAQDLLAADGHSDVSLERIVRAALGAFEATRLRVEMGPRLSFQAGTVTLLTLALHELATNAAKHGALSVADGSVTLGWTLRGGRVELTWTEVGGPAVSPPQRSGYGSRLLEHAARRLPHGALRRDFRPEGVQVTIAFDLQTGEAG